MPEDSIVSNQAAESAPPPPRRNRFSRFLTWTLSIVLLLSLAVLYAPGYVARYLITSEMDSLGIDYEGVP
jgi:hypothetical protein